ncbi:hypothetical protein OHP008_05580 [Helicobacter pylori]|uniref:hypothetical protein n=1 Tax=Helicobacter pylori TaxID=210 RepID=UPI001CC68882|nr:hypothetical protein [Helicobacter pylori]BDA07923.1 hypothetical protein OHP008_05580 [Helicobacter pylori]
MIVVEQEVEVNIVEPLPYDKSRQVLIDGDSLIYMACHGNDDITAFNNAIGVFKDSVEHIMRACNGGANTLFLTGDHRVKGGNFRKLISPDYKANRTVKPNIFKEVKEWVIDHSQKELGVKVECGVFVEADDLIIERASLSPRSVIACIDKDIVGNANTLCFNYKHNEFIVPNELEAKVFELKQCIIGDSTDNIKGVAKIGEKKTQSLFQPYLDRFKQGEFDQSYALLREALFNEVVLPLFQSQYGELQGYIKAVKPPLAKARSFLTKAFY